MQQNKQAAYLIIRQGNRWTDVFRMENSQSLVIGRASSNDIPVADERASRRHAEIFFDDGNWILRDLNSRNGTLLDGSKIDAPKVLSPGNQIVVASCRMTFVHSLTDYVPPPADSDGHNDSPVSQTEGDLPPSILHRQSKASMLESQEISSLPPVGPTKTGPVPSVPAGPAPGLANQVYGNALADPTTSAARAANILPLAFELAKSSSMHDACELALSRLLQVTGCMAGGIVKIDPQSTQIGRAHV